MHRHRANIVALSIGLLVAPLTAETATATTISLPGLQTNCSIAVDSSGQRVVIGMTDHRTGSERTTYLYSDDGGTTLTDGGALPSPTPTTQLSFGISEVKYLGGSNFIFFSSMFSLSSFSIAIVFHRSSDYGHTWQGPFLISPTAINNGHAYARSADVDPDTGRVVLSVVRATSHQLHHGLRTGRDVAIRRVQSRGSVARTERSVTGRIVRI